MGLFFFTKSVALVEDLPLEDHYDTPNEFYAAADKAYEQVSDKIQCHCQLLLIDIFLIPIRMHSIAG